MRISPPAYIGSHYVTHGMVLAALIALSFFFDALSLLYIQRIGLFAGAGPLLTVLAIFLCT